ncbi:hypothetical protein [Actinacidiphila glaucinigra]|uniref:hypothetical protein n=1 Tax=Actinacidiphila glaucinigra TaxID=235986 RepID=UPI002E333D93|nr:hypothetical protein [Actinacidiphila glaucinigra]
MQRSSLGACALVLAAAASVGACGSADADRARGLAREACANYEMFLSSDFSTADERETAHRRVVPALEDSARQASQAARLDADWQELALGLSRVAEQTSASLDLADLQAGTTRPDDPEEAEELQARVLNLGGEIDAHDPEAQCLKTRDS